MPTPYAIYFGDPADPATERLTGEMSDALHTRVVDFVKFARELGNVDCVRDGSFGRLEVSYRDATMEVTAASPSAVDQLLMAFRPFYVPGERTRFENLTSDLRKDLADPRLRAHLDALRQAYAYKARRDRAGFWITAEEPPLEMPPPDARVPFPGAVSMDDDKALDLWLNGYKYHRDPHKRARVEALCGTPEMITYMGQVLMLNVARKVEAVAALATVLAPFADGVRFRSDAA